MNPIKLISQKFYKELSSGYVPFLLGNTGDKIRVETSVSVQNYAISTIDDGFIFNNTDGFIGSGWIQDPDGQFGNFNIGDTIIIFNQATSAYQTGTIAAKQDNSNIQVTVSGGITGGNNFLAQNFVISITTAIASIKYHYNFIDNGGADSFISPYDGSEQVFVIESKAASDTSTSQMIPLGPLTWQAGLAGSLTTPFGGGSVSVCSIAGVSIDNGTTDGVYKSNYLIKHYTDLPRYITYTQALNQMKGIYPSDFLPPGNINSGWKFITQIDALEDYANPNIIVSEIFDGQLGNVGWYGENFNTGKTNYSIGAVTYVNNSVSTPSIHLDSTETQILIPITNTTDSPFTSSTKFIVEFSKVPADPSEYQNNGNLLDQNFCFDRALQQVGVAAVNGDNYGGTFQVLKGITGTLLSSSSIAIVVKIDMSAAIIAAFEASANPMYFISVSIQNAALATTDGTLDLVSLEADMNTFTVVTSDPTMIVIEPNVFLRHPEANPATEGVTVSPGVVGNDPTPLTWVVNESAGSPSGILITDSANVHTIGVADWTTNLNTTMNLLVTSINTNTSKGTIFGGHPAFTNAAGYTAAWNAGTNTFTLNAPTGSGATFNTVSDYLFVNGSGWTITGGTSGSGGYYNTFSGGVNTIAPVTMDVYPEDEVVSSTNFYIESSGRTSDIIKLTGLTAQIIAKNGSKSFVLDFATFYLSTIPLTGFIQVFDSQRARVFHVPADSIRKFVEVKRRADLDSGTQYWFSSSFAFLIRWETWVAALGIDPSFLNYSLPNNGLNEWWYQYGQSAGWSLNFQLIINATKNGAAQQYSQITPFVIHDYASNSAFTKKSVLLFDATTLSALQSGSGGATQLQTGGTSPTTINGQVYYFNETKDFFYSTVKTLIVAIFTKTTLPVNYNVVIYVELYQSGGVAGRRRYSSKWVADSDTWFSSTDGSGKVVMEIHSDTIVAYCYLDPTTLNFPAKITSFDFDARIYEIGGVLETDDSVPLETDDGVQIEID